MRYFYLNIFFKESITLFQLFIVLTFVILVVNYEHYKKNVCKATKLFFVKNSRNIYAKQTFIYSLERKKCNPRLMKNP